MEADDFYSQNSVSDIAAHSSELQYLKRDNTFQTTSSKMLSFEKYYPEHGNPRRQSMWIVNPFVEHKQTALSHEETLQLVELSSDKGLESTFNSMSDSKLWLRMKN